MWFLNVINSKVHYEKSIDLCVCVLILSLFGGFSLCLLTLVGYWLVIVIAILIGQLFCVTPTSDWLVD
jgi:hypothetical protein